MYKLTSILIGFVLLWETRDSFVSGYGLPTSQHAQPYPYQFHNSPSSNNYQNYVNLDGNSYPEAKATPFDYYNPYYGGDNFFRQDHVVPKSQFGYPYQVFVVSNANSNANTQRHPGHSASSTIPHRNLNPFNLAASLLSNFEAFDDGLSASQFSHGHHGAGSSSSSDSSENLDFPLTGLKQFFKQQFGAHHNPNPTFNSNSNSNVRPVFSKNPFESQYPSQNQMPNIAHSQIQIEIIPHHQSNSGSDSDSGEFNLDGAIKYNIGQGEPEIKIKLVEDSPDSLSILPVDGQGVFQVISTSISDADSDSSPMPIPSPSTKTTEDGKTETLVPVNIQIKTQVPVDTDVNSSERKEDVAITNSPVPMPMSSNENVNEPQMVENKQENDDNSPLTILAVENSEDPQDVLHDTVIISLPQDSNSDSMSSSSSDEAVRDFVKEQEAMDDEQDKKKPNLFVAVSGSGSSSSSSEEKIPMAVLLGGSDKDILSFKSGLSSTSTPKPATEMTSEKSVAESKAETGTATEMMLEAELTTETPGKIQARDDITIESTSSPSQVMDDEASGSTTFATEFAIDDAVQATSMSNLMNDEEKVTTSAPMTVNDDSENNMTTTGSPLTE